MPQSKILRAMACFAFLHVVHTAVYDMRMAKAKIIPNANYVAAYHLHAMGTFASGSLRSCIYRCQNNDYCRTATYFDSNAGTMCSLFEEYSHVGQIIHVSSSMSTVVAFDLCPPGFTEPAYICFGVPPSVQPPVPVQQALANLRYVSQFALLTYHPMILPMANSLYLPLHTQTTVRKFDWPSLKSVANLTVPLPLYSYDTDASGSLLLSSSNATKVISVTGPSGNWSYSSIVYYAVFLSNSYVVATPTVGNSIHVLNATTGQVLFIYTMPTSDNLWARVINRQLYITSATGLRRVNLTEGVSASATMLVPSLSCKQIFLDASGRLYVEKNDATLNNSIVYDLNGARLANYSSGSKLIVKASKYAYYVLNNQLSVLQLYRYP